MTRPLKFTLNPATPASQKGVALVMVLLFLVAITGITVWAARQSMLGEGMARNQQDMEVARQAAESALRDAERDIENAGLKHANWAVKPDDLATDSCIRSRKLIAIDFTTDCAKGLCIRTDAQYANYQWSSASASNGGEPWWPTGKGGQWVNDFNGSTVTKPGRTPVDQANCASFKGGVPLGTYTGAVAIKGVSVQPEYLIEYFKRAVAGQQERDMYRITARGFGYTPRTQVVVQSIYLP
ncbi:PilX N-terminal domain-containing pilus assembly protein [Rhodoferax sp. WC2427]|uniref:pilus assembly PilX family protein n=1 Tax=Rhodoferax sp. WC2427 TaxID=3234144 RepID=UPI003465E0A0